MGRRQHTREFKLEAVRLIRDRGVSYTQAARDLGVHQSMLRNWVKAFGDEPLRLRVLDVVRRFDAFTPDNDPYGEHDCAVIELDDVRIIWKIDYYDLTFSGGSDDPADPSLTCRLLTIMLAEEN